MGDFHFAMPQGNLDFPTIFSLTSSLLGTHVGHIWRKDIAWSDLLTEAVYSTHLRDKPDQGPSCLECSQICGEFYWILVKMKAYLTKHGGVPKWLKMTLIVKMWIIKIY